MNIEKIYKKIKLNFEKIDIFKKIDEFEKLYYTNMLKYNITYFPLVQYKINDNIVTYKVKKYNSTGNTDDRIEHILELIKKSLKPERIINTILFIWISDRFPWETDIQKYIPLYVFAKPKNTNYLIFPDNTFQCLNLEEKHKSECYNFDIIKNLILKKCKKNKKTNKIYFKGANTNRFNHKLRNNLEEYSKTKKWITVKLDGETNYEPIYNFCKYKILLNLPGHYPWSNRFKYLFLMKSLVINISVKTINTNSYYIDKPYISFIDYFVKPNKDYLDIKMTYYKTNKNDSNESIQKIIEKNKQEFIKIKKKLKKIYKNIHKYDEIINNGFSTVSKLNMNYVYDYIFNCMCENEKIIKI
jgi:hypothetical protein